MGEGGAGGEGRDFKNETFINQHILSNPMNHKSNILKDQLLQIIGHNSQRKAAKLVDEFIQAEDEEKEGLLASIEIEKWLSECCQSCLNGFG